MTRPTALIIGGGIVGLSCALALSRRFAVTVIDPGGPNASTVAAGMLAPATEAALDDQAPPYPLLAAALDAWPSFASEIGASSALDRCGALIAGPDAEILGERVRACGATAEILSAADAVRLQPAVTLGAAAVWAPGEARVDVAATLRGLWGTLADLGVTLRNGWVVAMERGAALLDDGDALSADQIVLAAGHVSGTLAPLGELTPIRGQLIRFARGAPPTAGALVRSPAGYLVPSAEGAVFGATMEPGVTGGPVNDAVCAGLADAARALAPTLQSTPWRGAAGVRAATVDGRPLVGRSGDGLLVATGFRRNGWLLSPLAAGVVAALAEGRDPGPWAGLMDPERRPLKPARN